MCYTSEMQYQITIKEVGRDDGTAKVFEVQNVYIKHGETKGQVEVHAFGGPESQELYDAFLESRGIKTPTDASPKGEALSYMDGDTSV